MSIATVEEIYEQIVKRLPVTERWRLVEKIARDLSAPAAEPDTSHDWMSLRGIAPNLLAGADAQAWVSRTRRESDEEREAQWRPRS